jgi:hypothetical protein
MEGETTADGMFTLREVYIVYMYIFGYLHMCTNIYVNGHMYTDDHYVHTYT